MKKSNTRTSTKAARRTNAASKRRPLNSVGLGLKPSTANVAARQEIKRLQSLIQASQLLNTTLDLDKLLKIILDLTLQNLNAARGTIYLIDHGRNELWSKVVKGRELVEIRLPVGTGIAGNVAKTGKTINLEDAWKDKRFYSGFDVKSGFKTKSMLCMPMRNRQKKIIGVFQVLNKQHGVFDSRDEEFLEAFSDHAALAIENAMLHQAIVEKERVEKEIQIAGEIQRRLLPKEIPVIPSYQVDAAAIPSKSVGGDYFNIIPLEDGRWLLVIADVSGKGIPASLLVSTLHASLHAYIQSSADLVELSRRLNAMVYRNTSPERYITFFSALLDTQHHTLAYVNAGHNFPFRVQLGSDALEPLSVGGLPLGMFELAEYQAGTVELNANDTVVLYTDGVTEAMDEGQNEYSDERLKNIITSATTNTAFDIKSKILTDVRKFTGDEPQSDDLTLMVLKRTAN
ncbi:MAG: SpoIIE family protein phosphatase [Ignavibacteriae bacterium]|nr:SpoIIE family protein phosphatase [Ignavibacteriota bacterium]